MSSGSLPVRPGRAHTSSRLAAKKQRTRATRRMFFEPLEVRAMMAFTPGDVWRFGSDGSESHGYSLPITGGPLGSPTVQFTGHAPGQIAWSADLRTAYVTSFNSGADNAGTVVAITDGGITTFATGLDGPTGIVRTSDGRLLVAEYSSGTVVDISGGGDLSSAVRYASGLSAPRNLVQRADGSILVVEEGSDEVTALAQGGDLSGATPFARLAASATLSDIVEGSSGALFVSDPIGKRVFNITAGGDLSAATPFATGRSFIGLTYDAQGRLLAAGTGADGSGVFDISAGGDFSTTAPLVSNLSNGTSAIDTVPESLLTTQLSVSDGNLTISDNVGRAETLTIRVSGSNLVVHDPGAYFDASAGVVSLDQQTLTIPLASITGSIVINTGAGSDELNIDLTSGEIGRPIVFDGGESQNDFDVLRTTGGSFETVVHYLTGPGRGNFALGSTAISYRNLEPVDTTATVIADLTFNISAGVTDAILRDRGTSSDGLMELVFTTISQEDQFFQNPADSLTIVTNGNNSLVALQSRDAGFSPTSFNLLGVAGDTFRKTAAGDAIPSTVVTLADATLDLNGHNEELGVLAGSAPVTLGGATLTIASNFIATFGGSITGAGGLVKNGVGIQTLSGRLSGINSIDVLGGELALTNTGAATSANSLTGTMSVSTGAILTATPTTASNPLGTAAITLNGGKLNVDTVTTTHANALGHYGYHTPVSDAVSLNLHNNRGMIGGGDPATFTAFEGLGPLTDGPASRGLDFDNDADFRAVLASLKDDASGDGKVIDQDDNYSNLFIGYFIPNANGTWSFNNPQNDDTVGMWIDLDQDGVFESSTFGLGSGRGEQISWEDTGTKNVTLTAGQRYLVAFAHREGTGGSQIDVRYAGPSFSNRAIEPGDLAQAGMWGFVEGTTAALGNNVTVAATNSAIDVNGHVSLGTLTYSAATLELDVNGTTDAGAIKSTLTFAGTTSINASALDHNIDVTLQGIVSESVAGSGLIKRGAGTLSLNGANTHTGQTTIENGTVRLGNALALGTDLGKTVIQSGASLDLNGNFAGSSDNELIEVAGAGFGGQGAILNTGVGIARGLRRVTLTGDATFRADNRYDIRNTGGAATFDMGGFTLTKVGTGEFCLIGATVNNEGNVNANQGTFRIETTTDFDGPTRTISVAAGATLDFYNNTQTHDAMLTLAAGANVTANGGGGATISGLTTLNGLVNVTANNNLTLSGQLTGTGGLSKAGGAILTLPNGTNNYSGLTIVTGGTLSITNASALGTTAGATYVRAGGTLQLTGALAAITEPITLFGTLTGASGILRSMANNTIDGPLSVSMGGTITSATAGTTLTINGPFNVDPIAVLTLDGVGNIDVNSSFGSGTTVANALTGYLFEGSNANEFNAVGSGLPIGMLARVPNHLETYKGGLSFNNAFANGFAGLPPGYRGDNFSSIWLGTITPAATGNHTFSVTTSDDFARVWIDLDQDGKFEDSAAQGAAAGNEMVLTANNAAVTGTAVSLTAGISYRIAFGFHENSGNEVLNFQIAGPGIATQTVNPSAANQTGLFSTVAATHVIKTGAGVARLLGSNTFAGTTEVRQGSLVGAAPSALGSPAPGSSLLPTAGNVMKWRAGTDNGNNSEFGTENGASNAAPGSATAKDDDWYFAGNYPATVGVVAADEALANFERALTAGDPTKRIHFNLAADEVDDNFQLVLDFVSSSFTGGSTIPIQVFVNEVLVHSQSITADTVITTATFNGATVNATTGDNVIRVTRSTAAGTGAWTQFDRVDLNRQAMKPAANTLISSGATLAVTAVNPSESVVFSPGSTYRVAVNGATTGQLDVTGTVDLGGAALSVSQVAASAATQLTIINNDGTEPIVGQFAGLPEGAQVLVAGGNAMYLSYVGGDGNDVVLSTQPIITGTAGVDVVSVTALSGGNITVSYSLNGGAVVGGYTTTTPPTSFDFLGSDGVDVLNVQLAGNGAVLPTINFDGGNPVVPGSGDVLHVQGTKVETARYLSDAAVERAGTITLAGIGVINFTGLEPVNMFDLALAEVNFANANDIVTLADGFGATAPTATDPAIVVSGTSGGLAFESVHLHGNTSVVINTATNGVNGTDTITLDQIIGAHDNTNLSIDTAGSAGDTIHVNGEVRFTATGSAVSLASGSNIAFGATGYLNATSATSNVTLTAGAAITDDDVDVDVAAGSLSTTSGAAAGISLDFNVSQLTTDSAAGNGPQDLNQLSGTATIQGLNAGTGTATLTGLFTTAGANVIGDTTAVAVSNSLTLGGNETVGSIAGAGALVLGANTLTTGGTNASTTFSGPISGVGGGLTKVGSGTMTLSGTSTYTGATAVNAGTLLVTTAGSIAGTSSLAIDAGTFQIVSGASVTVTGGVTNGAGAGSLLVDEGTMTVGNSLSVDTLRVGNLDSDGGTANLTVSGGAVTIGNGTENLDIGVRQGTFTTPVTPTPTVVGTLNLTGASSVVISAAAVRIGNIIGSPANEGTAGGNLLLATAGSNSITANSITLGDSVARGNQVLSTIQLGGTTNAFNTDLLEVGGDKSQGHLLNAAGGSLTLQGKVAGTRADVDIGISVGTGVSVVGIFNTGTGTLNALIDLLRIGGQPGSGTAVGSFIFAAGTVSANSVAFGTATNGTGTIQQLGGAFTVIGGITDGTGVGNLNVDAGTMTVGTGLQVDNLRVGRVTAAGGGTATLTVNGGAVSLGVGTGNTVSIGRHELSGGAAVAIGTANFQNATSLTATVGTFELGVISHTGASGGVGTRGTLNMPSAGGTITATTVTLGSTPTPMLPNSAAESVINFAAASYTINADTIVIGGPKTDGRLTMAAGGTLNVAGRVAGTRADLFIANNNIDTGANSDGTVDLTGSTLNGSIDELRIGRHGQNTGNAKGSLTFSAGSVNVNTLAVAEASAGTSSSASLDTTGSLTMQGGTLAVNTAMTVGLNGGQGSVTATGGTLSIGSGPASSFVIGRTIEVTNPAGTSVSTVNLAGAASVTVNVGQLLIGTSTAGAGGATSPNGTLVLGAANVVTAATEIRVGDSPGVGLGPTINLLRLGATNTINTPILIVGGDKAFGTMDFASAGSTLTLGAVGSPVDLIVGNQTAGTSGGANGIVNWTNGTVTAVLDEVVLGRKPNGAAGPTTASLTFAAGSIEANSLRIAVRTDAGNAGTVTGVLTLNGGSFVVNGDSVIGQGNTGVLAGSTLGTLNLNGSAGFATNGLTLGQNSNVGGVVNHNSGSVQFVTMSTAVGGARDYNWTSGTIATLSGQDLSNTNVPVDLLTAATHTISIDAGRTGTFGGSAPLTSAGSLTKIGGGNLILQADNTYSGSTNVNAGVLTLQHASNNNIAASPSVTVAAGATLNVMGLSGGRFDVVNGQTLRGEGTVTGAVQVNAGGQIAPGMSPGILNTGSVSFVGGSFAVEIEGDAAGSGAGFHDQLNVTGTVALGAGLATLIVTGSFVANLPTGGLQDFVLINNDGTDDTTGYFASLQEGSAVTLNGRTLYITYNGGDGNDVVLNTQPILSGTSLSDTLEITPLAGGNLQYAFTAGPLAGTSGTIIAPQNFHFGGNAGDDVLIVNVNGNPLPAGGITLDGEARSGTNPPTPAGGDALKLVGSGQDAVYQPHLLVTGQGVIVVSGPGGGTIGFTGLEPVDMTGFGDVTLELLGANDLITIAEGVDSVTGLIPALVLSGSSGGVAIEALHAWNNASVIVDTTVSDADDTVTITGAANAHGNANLVIETGAGTDSVTFSGAATFTGDVTVDSQTIAVNSLITAARVALDANTGAITTSGASVDVAATTLTAVAATGIDLDTQIVDLSASVTGAGNLQIDEVDGLNLTALSVSNGTATLVAGGALSDSAGTVVTVSGNATLTAAGIVLGDNAADSTNFGTLTFVSSAGVSISEDSSLNLIGASSGAGGVTLASTDGSFSLPAGASLSVSGVGADITLNIADDVVIAGAITAVDQLAINLDGGLADVGGSTLSIAASSVITTGGGATGGTVITGGAEADVFSFRPQATTAFVVDGGAPVLPASPGDFLNLDLTGFAAGSTILTLGPTAGSGSYSFAAPQTEQSVSYTSIETVDADITGGYHLVLDLGYSGLENGLADTVDARLSTGGGANLELSVNSAPFFSGVAGSIRSLSVIGSDDADTFTLTEVNGQLPSFVAAAPAVDNTSIGGGVSLGAHQNATSTAVLGAQPVTIHFVGGAGSNTLGLVLTSADDATYFADTVGSDQSGNLSVPADTLLSFVGAASLDLTGAGGTLTVDASSTPAVSTITLDSPAVGETSISGNVDLATSLASGFAGLSVLGGDGAETIEVLAVGAGLTTLTLSGNNRSGTDAAADTLRVHTLPAGITSASLIGGAGSDTFQLYSSTSTVDGIQSPVTINGSDGNIGGNTDALVVIDSGDANGDTVAITQNSIEGLTGYSGTPDVSFTNIDVLTVTTTAGADTITTTLAAGSDLNTVTVSGNDLADQFYLSLPDPGAGPGSGVTTVNLNGDEGNDSFGDATTKIQPSRTTAININGGLPTPGGLPTSNTVGDHLSLDLSAIATTSAVIVTTAPGQVIASGYAGFSFVDIEDLDLYDSTGLTTIEMGDLYARGTEQADSFVFTNGWLPSQPSLMRVMINSFGGYLTIPGKIVVYARGGNDYLTQHDTPRVAHFYGEGGNDYLAGALQADLLVGGLNDDQLLGSSGSDTIWGDEGPTPANPAPQDDVAGGFDRINGGLGNDIIYAGGGNDQAYGNGDDDYLHGGQGDDTLDGGEGNDRLYGSFGNDQLSGYFGYDLLSGGDGNDILTGNANNDVLIGGLGSDSLVGNEDSDLLVTGSAVPVGTGATSANSTTAGDANDQALLALLLAWGTTGTDRSLLGTVTQDGVYDEVFSGNGNDDITRDNPLDRLFDFTVGTDEEF